VYVASLMTNDEAETAVTYPPRALHVSLGTLQVCLCQVSRVFVCSVCCHDSYQQLKIFATLRIESSMFRNVQGATESK
jgi:hypothetical protein